MTPAKSFTFNPITFQSREEIGPRVLITHFKKIPFKNRGQPLIGKSNDLYEVKGDRNCYFRVVSFYLSGSKNYHKEIRKTICDYINFFPGRLSALIQDKNEQANRYQYTHRTKMNKLGTWATKVKILAMAKCLKRDIIMLHNGQWQRYSYINTEPDDAIYLDNITGRHFDTTLSP